MQRRIATFSTVLLLAGASCRRSAETDAAAFVLETPRAEVVKRLTTSGAEILENTESNLVADLKLPNGKQQMHVNLAFQGGALKSVHYIPQPGR